jgi:hypothetical protein
MDLTRGGFFRLGATGAATAAGGMLVGGTAFAAPPPAKPVGDDVGFLTSRLLVARLLTVDGQLLGALREMIGKPIADGLPIPLSTEQAGDALDKLITVPGSPGGG